MTSPLRGNLVGFSDSHDRLWLIKGDTFEYALTEYNDELTGYDPRLPMVFGKKVVIYGGNAYYILNLARERGYTVEHIEDRYG